jgi:hypothetical protein
MTNIALAATDDLAKGFLGEAEPLTYCFDGAHPAIVAPLLLGVNSGAVLTKKAVPLPFLPMGKPNKRAKVTPETIAEAQRLRALWETRSHPVQAVFGEVYEIGNQSAVGQFLRGETPLSPNAARGFAKGLNCQISDFSPRLAALAVENAEFVIAPGEWPFSLSLRNEVAKADPVSLLIMENLMRSFLQMKPVEDLSTLTPPSQAKTEGQGRISAETGEGDYSSTSSETSGRKKLRNSELGGGNNESGRSGRAKGGGHSNRDRGTGGAGT